jgi:hypothetical protein
MTADTPKLSRFQQRVVDRRNGDAPLSDDDKLIVDLFIEATAMMTDVIKQEIVAIDAVDLGSIPDLNAKKSEILRSLEANMPLLEDLVQRNPEIKEKVQAAVFTMLEASKDVGVKLERITTATQSIAKEITHIMERHSLNGIYAADGMRKKRSNGYSQKIDQNL